MSVIHFTQVNDRNQLDVDDAFKVNRHAPKLRASGPAELDEIQFPRTRTTSQRSQHLVNNPDHERCKLNSHLLSRQAASPDHKQLHLRRWTALARHLWHNNERLPDCCNEGPFYSHLTRVSEALVWPLSHVQCKFCKTCWYSTWNVWSPVDFCHGAHHWHKSERLKPTSSPARSFSICGICHGIGTFTGSLCLFPW